MFASAPFPDYAPYLSAAVGALVAVVAIWIQTHLHKMDKRDAATLRDTARQVGEVQAVLVAWRSIVQANEITLTHQATEIGDLRVRLELRETENLALKTEVASLRIRIATLEAK